VLGEGNTSRRLDVAAWQTWTASWYPTPRHVYEDTKAQGYTDGTTSFLQGLSMHRLCISRKRILVGVQVTRLVESHTNINVSD
jgi:hypothetical protein